MKDHIWEHNNRYRITAVEGQKDQFDLIPVPGTVYQVGTPINKATLLQDETVQRYNNTENTKNIEETPDGVFRSLSQAQAFSTAVLLTSSQTVGYNQTELEAFAKFENIEHDATGKCTFDTDNRCTKIYVPKGIKKVLVQLYVYAAEQASGQAKATIYKNGSAVQSVGLYLPSNGTYYTRLTENVITTTGTGNEYIQIYLNGAKGNWAGALSVKHALIQMLSY